MINKTLAKEILDMVRRDQRMRFASMKDSAKWDTAIDEHNTKRLRELIKEFGWPTRSKVGKKASDGAWLLAQHADKNPAFQRRVLKLMQQIQAATPGEVELRHIALLTDRTLLASGKKQEYGTQFWETKKGLVPRPLRDPKRVNERRARMGLETIEQNQKNIRAMVKKHSK